MAEVKTLSASRYSKLVGDVRKLIEQGRARTEDAAKNELVRTYWEIGKRIESEGLTQNASYGESIIEDLSDELKIDVDTLYRAVHFFKAYKVAPRGENLTWSHYRELLGVKENSVRFLLEEKANQQEWTRDQLVKAIRSEAQSGSELNRSGKTRSAIKIKKIMRPDQATYVYKAVVENVVDGDTLVLRIDLGFQVWKEQRIRLAEVVCPAMDEPKGRAAYDYVRTQMAKTEFVIVKTNKIDIYGRYIGHIFYSLEKKPDKVKVFEQGRYLNQELIDKGLAILI